ncbi:MAG: hypothetical protein ACK4VO_01835 [Pseudobdellovibrio sp.]
MIKTFFIFLCITICFVCLSSNSWADVQDYIRPTKPLIMPTKKESVYDLQDLSLKLLPPKLDAGESSDSFMTKVADNGLALYWERSPLRQTSMGRAAEKVEKKMKVEVDLKDQNNNDHKFSFKLLAIQTLAKVEYVGWVKAALNYDFKSSKTEAEIIESISQTQDIVLSQTKSADDQSSKLSFRLKW